jgi:hypothetical protein
MAGEATELKTQGAGFGAAFDKIDFEWGDDGQINLSEVEEIVNAGTTEEGSAEASAEAQATDDEVQETLEAGESDGDEEDAGEGAGEGGDAAGDEATAKIAEMQAEIDALKAELKTDTKTPEDQTGATEQKTVDSLIPEDKDIIDVLSDKETGVAFIEDAIQLKLNPLVDALRPMVIQWRVHQEVTEMFEKHGEDFNNKLPVIKTLVQKRPDLTLKQAYELVKSVNLPDKPTAKTGQVEATDDSGSDPKAEADPIAEANAIAAKAEKLKTEEGVAGSKTESGHATTVKQALHDAIDEHYSNV